jgi:hypothetical protein
VKAKIAIVLLTSLVVIGGAALFWVLNTPPPATTSEPARPPEPKGEPPAPPAAPTPAVATPTKSSAPRPAPTVEAPVEVAPTMGTLVIESDVPDTSVFIDRVYLGTAPVTAENLAPGPHHLNMSAAGYEGVSETIEVAAGTHTFSKRFKDITLDEQIAVVHKHAMGSCAGTLRASPQGLAYETETKNDAFSAPLQSLEAFEVDYLKKNLRVKIRGGKTYNFTVADGNADRLYVFHQTVDKVRQRLLAAGKDGPLAYDSSAIILSIRRSPRYATSQ